MWFVGTSCLPYDVYVDQGNVPVWFYLYGKPVWCYLYG